MDIPVWRRTLLVVSLLLLSAAARAHPEVIAAAKEYGVPPKLLAAVMMQESRGHPWTLNIDGESFYLNSKREAVKLAQFVQDRPWMLVLPGGTNGKAAKSRYFFATEADARRARMQSGSPPGGSIRKIRPMMIDLGLMQINLYWHHEQMGSFEQALDPAWNLRYGAKYLASLIRQKGSVKEAIGYYNAKTYSKRLAYTRRVLGWYRKL